MEGTARLHQQTMQHFNERQRRIYAASIAKQIGYGGMSRVRQELGMDIHTISRGMRELAEDPLIGRIRLSGGGRKKLSVKQPDLVAKTVRVANPKADPMSPIRWTSLSMKHIANAVKALGHTISPMSTYRILKAKGFALKANKKEIEGKGQHPDRNAQFEHINARGLRMQINNFPILSVDAKKTELIGNFKNNGQEWQPKGTDILVNTHDFGERDADKKIIKGIPYGVYNVLKKQGFVNVGIDHNTAAFAVESLRRYWETYGEQAYPEATEMLILADGGSSNGARNRLWKKELQELANETHLTIHVSHYPPYTSKWNAIEHELFSFISINWRAKPLTSYEVMLELLNHTKNKGGLTVTAMKDTNSYPTKIKVTDKEFEKLKIIRDSFHGDWNYTIKPQ